MSVHKAMSHTIVEAIKFKNMRIKIVLISLIMLAGCSGINPKLGLSNGHLMQCPDTPNCVNSQAKDKEYFIQPILFTGTQQEAQIRLLKVLDDWKRTKITVTQDNYIRAEFASMLFRFVDDAEFYFPETKTKEITIHIRSASRIGYSDFGVNRKRIEQIRSDLQVN